MGIQTASVIIREGSIRALNLYEAFPSGESVTHLADLSAKLKIVSNEKERKQVK
jgi:hypothetical protein